MAEIPDSMNWMNFWNDFQKQSMDNWQSTMRKSTPSPSFAMDNPMQYWQESVNKWWRAFDRSPTPTPEQAFWKNTQSSGEWFFKLGEEVFRMLQGVQDGARMGKDWTDALHQTLNAAKETIQKSMTTDINAFYGLFGMPMDTIQRVMASSSFFPGDVFKSFPSMRPQTPGVFDPAMKANLEQFLSTPAIGYTREWQEQNQQGMMQVMEYQESLQEYMTLISKGLGQAIDLFHRRLLERGAGDKPIHSLKELYSLMVDCGEDAFSEMAYSQEYSRANARMINSMMRIKNQSRLVMEEGLTALNMPSRTELDTAHHNILELKRRVRSLEAEVRALKKRDMEPEVAALKEDVEQLPIMEFRSELEKLKKQMQDSLLATDKGESDGEGESGEGVDGDDKLDPNSKTTVRRTRTPRAKPQSEGA